MDLNHATDKRSISDSELADQLRRSLPNAPEDPWFTRKVLNRLEDRPRKIAARIEYILYIIGIATTAVVATNMGGEIIQTSSITLSQIIALPILAALAGTLSYALIAPLTAIRK